MRPRISVAAQPNVVLRGSVVAFINGSRIWSSPTLARAMDGGDAHAESFRPARRRINV